MASGSIELPSPTFSLDTSMPIANGHKSPSATEGIEDDVRSESVLSEPSDEPSHPSSSHSSSSAPTPEEVTIESSSDSSDASSEEDAEGSDDADYEETTRVVVESASEASSPEPSRSIKRKLNKFSKSESDYFRKNPELFGLRHSARAVRKPIIESDSEDDDSAYDESRKRKRPRTNLTVTKSSSHRSTPMVATPRSDSDDEEYIQSRRQQLSKSQKQRQMQVAAGIIQETIRSTRVDTRRAGLSIKNYNEDVSDDAMDEDGEEYTSGYYATDAVDTGPQIDQVIKADLLDGVEMDPDVTRDDFRYLIKWQNKAHLHATWHTYQELKDMGLRMNKMDNYWKYLTGLGGDINIKTNPDVEPEELEDWYIKRDEYLQAQEDHQKICRVIDDREGEDGTEYYVLWKGLQYDKCTWESAQLVSSLAQGEIDRYLDRSSNLPRSKSKQTSQHVPLLAQPSYIKFGELREFQLKGLNFLCHSWVSNKNVILADEMGLGKTVQTVAWLNWLRNAQCQQGPFLIVVPLSTMPAWADTFDKWTPDINYIQYHGNRMSREIIQQHELLIDNDPRRPKFHVLLTTYELANKESDFFAAIRWQALVVDEAHRLKNRDSKLYDSLMRLNVGSKLLLTGTPLQNNLTELDALMNFIMPGVLDIDVKLDLRSETAAEELWKVNSTMRKFMLRRTKKMVMQDLPPLTEHVLRVPLSETQVTLSKNIVERNYGALNAGSNGPKQSLLNIMMELKKCCNHPFLFPNQKDLLIANSSSKEEYLRLLITTSGKMMLLDRLLAKLKKENHRVLIFTQMVKMLDILGEYLRLRGYKFQRLDGTIQAAARARAMDHFQDPESDDFCFILSTRAGGLGLNLMAADTVIIFDSDWNPQADVQALSRAHRMGQKKPVSAFRFISKETVEEKILERARNKRMLEYLTIQFGYGDVEKKERERQLQKAGVVTGEPTTAADLSRILKQGSQAMFQQQDNQKQLEEMDVDQLLAEAEIHKDETDDVDAGFLADGGDEFLKSFQYTDVKLDVEWDEIIPQDKLEVLKAEEKRRREEEETRALIEESRPRKRKATNTESREQRAAKKKAKIINKQAAAISEDEEDAKNDSGDDIDPTRPLNVKETRNLIEAYKKFGFFEDAQEDIVKEARLETRDPSVLKEVIDAAYAEANKLYKDAQEELEAQEQESTTKTPAKKERKEVLFNFRGTKNQNATTIVERPEHLRLMRNAVKAVNDPKSFRVAIAKKAADYTCNWGAREDGMLVVGVVKHGYGAWPEIRDDPELGMTDKLFLEEKRVATVNENKEKKEKGEKVKERKPQATHLVRRVKYLIDCLKVQSGAADEAALKALENHHRNRKKLLEAGESVSNISSPGARASTPGGRKVIKDVEKLRNRGNSRAGSQQRLAVERNGVPDLAHKNSDETRTSELKHANKHQSPGRDEGVDRIRRPSEPKHRRESNEHTRKRHREGENVEREHKRHKSKDERSDAKRVMLNGANDRHKPRLPEDVESAHRSRHSGDSYEPYDARDPRRSRDPYVDSRRREHHHHRDKPRSRSPMGRRYPREEERDYRGGSYHRDRYDPDGRRADAYDRDLYGRDRNRDRYPSLHHRHERPDRSELHHRDSHGSSKPRPGDHRSHHEHRHDDREGDRYPRKVNRKSDHHLSPHRRDSDRRTETPVIDRASTRPVYDAQVHELLDGHVGKLKNLFESQMKAKDKAEKLKHIKAWLVVVADVVRQSNVPPGSALENQLWDYAAEQAWKAKKTKGEALKEMAAKLLKERSADTPRARKKEPAQANGAAAH